VRASVDLAEAVVAAHRQIEPWVRRTRLERSAIYSDMTGTNVFFKYENLQHTGSFKLRGATNWLLSLPPEQQGRQIMARPSLMRLDSCRPPLLFSRPRTRMPRSSTPSARWEPKFDSPERIASKPRRRRVNSRPAETQPTFRHTTTGRLLPAKESSGWRSASSSTRSMA